MRKSISSNGKTNSEVTSVIRQPKGPEAQGVKGFGRTMSRSKSGGESDPTTGSSSDEKGLNEDDFTPAEVQMVQPLMLNQLKMVTLNWKMVMLTLKQSLLTMKLNHLPQLLMKNNRIYRLCFCMNRIIPYCFT